MRDIDTLTRAWLGGLLTLTELTEKERRRIHIRVLALAIVDARQAEIVAATPAAAAAEPVPVNTRTCPRCHQVLELDQFWRVHFTSCGQPPAGSRDPEPHADKVGAETERLERLR
jgi:hypothetical protein